MASTHAVSLRPSLPFAAQVAIGCWFAAAAFAGDLAPSAVCEGFGPQTPRDIDSGSGDNADAFPIAPPASDLNLCNIHFHRNAEHRAEAFSIPAMAMGSRPGVGGGFRCALGESLSNAEREIPETNACSDVQPGDTIEVHWVHTSCDTQPGPKLGACVPDACGQEFPLLRVEAQVFVLVNDDDALDFREFGYQNAAGERHRVDGRHQAWSLPSGTGDPVVFRGSSTGPSYDESVCSPIKATWSVRPECAKLDIGSLSAWCERNDFQETRAQGVRELVTHPALLSPIGSH